MKYLLVIGATGGVGSELVKTADSSWTTIEVNSSGESLNSELRFQADITKKEEVDKLFDYLSENLQKDSHLGIAACVGSILLKPAHLVTDEQFEETLRKNLWSTFYILRAAAKRKLTESTSIVFFSSAASEIGLRNHEAIAAAKAGMTGMAKAAAATYARQNFRINVIAAGLMDTPLASRITGNETSKKASEEMHPVGRIGSPQDVAPFALQLLSPESSWVTGSVFRCDGGIASLSL